MLAFASVTQRLLAACRQGDEQLARDIVSQHPGIIASLTQDEQRVLADAAWNGHARAVTLMLELGFDPAVVYVPHPIQNRTKAEIEAIADAAFAKVIALLQSS